MRSVARLFLPYAACPLLCFALARPVASAEGDPRAGGAGRAASASLLLAQGASNTTPSATLAPSGGAVITTYTPSAAVNEAVKRRLVEDLAKRNPKAADQLGAALAQHDFREDWAKAVAADGLHPNDVADALTAYWILNWLMVHGQTDNTAAQVRGTRQQLLGGLAHNQPFLAMDESQRQDMAEALVYNFILQYIAYQSATTRHDANQLRQLAVAAEARFRTEYRVDLQKLALTDHGMAPASGSQPVKPATSLQAPPQLPVTAPGEGLKPADIARVGVEHYFGISPTGLVNTYDVFVFLRDGTYYHDPVVALADLDVTASRASEAIKWGRWSDQGGEVVFEHAGQTPTRKQAKDLAPCRPATSGQTLEGNYNSTGGSGPIIPGGIVTLSESDLVLHRDGTFARDSATAVGGGTGTGGTVGGGTTGPHAAGHYKLDGYSIELDGAASAPVRNFFCLYTDDDTMVFVGTTPRYIRSK